MLQNNKKIAVICLGGTILSLSSSPIDEFYSISSKSIYELIHDLPKFKNIELDVQHPFSVMSHDLSSEQLLQIVHLINDKICQEDIDGLVVVQGTNTIEEISFITHILIKTEKPIVFTGSMRPINALGYEGLRNLFYAICIASADQASGIGVLVTFNDYIYSARDLVKSNPSMINAFTTNMAGPLGYVIGENVSINYQPTFLHTAKTCFDIKRVQQLPHVSIIYGSIGDDVAVLEALDFSKIKGIISAGMGKGYQSAGINKWLDKAVKKNIALVRCSRSGMGVVNIDPNQNKKFIAGFSFSPAKAKLLLQVGLCHTSDTNLLQDYFAAF